MLRNILNPELLVAAAAQRLELAEQEALLRNTTEVVKATGGVRAAQASASPDIREHATVYHRAAARLSEHRRHLAKHGLCAAPRRLSQDQRKAKRARDQEATCAELQRRKEAKQAQEPKAKQAQEPTAKQAQEPAAKQAPLTLGDFIHPHKRGRGQTGPRGM